MKFVKLTSTAQTPIKGSPFAAGYDLYADITDVDCIKIPPHATVKVSTGIAIELPENTFGGIFPRSGLASKAGLAPANKVGVIDEDYRGPVIVALHNHSDEYRIVNHGERIAQLIVIPYQKVELEEVESLSDTVRGAGGFGSTGSK